MANETLSRVEAMLGSGDDGTHDGDLRATAVSDVQASEPPSAASTLGAAVGFQSPGTARQGDASWLSSGSEEAAGLQKTAVGSVRWSTAAKSPRARGKDVDPTFTASGRMVPSRTLQPERAMGSVVHALQGEVGDLQSRYDRLLAHVQEVGHVDDEVRTAMADIAAVLQDKLSQLELLRQAQEDITDARERSPVRNPQASKRRAEALRSLQRMRELAAETNRRVGGSVSTSGVDPKLLG